MLISMERWKGKVAIVTGASAGIGAAIVEHLVEAGLVVVGLARREEKLEGLGKKLQGKSGKLHAVAADITNEEDILKAFKWVKDNLGTVHILVNNTGVTRLTNLTEGDTKLWQDILNTNVLGYACQQHQWAHHPHKQRFRILCPTCAYSKRLPRKQARRDCLGGNIEAGTEFYWEQNKITNFSPGFVVTEIFEASAVGSGLTGLAPEAHSSLKPEDIADAVIHVLATPPHVQVHELMIRPVGEKF